MNMGLADECLERSTIIDFDNGGINVAPTNNAVYQEAYEVFLKSEITMQQNLPFYTMR